MIETSGVALDIAPSPTERVLSGPGLVIALVLVGLAVAAMTVLLIRSRRGGADSSDPQSRQNPQSPQSTDGRPDQHHGPDQLHGRPGYDRPDRPR